MITFVVHVENKPGVLTRVASLFRRRAYNIESLTVGHTETKGISRMTIVVDTDDEGAHHVEAHLYKLVNVLRVDNVTVRPAVTRELAMIKVATTGETRPQIMQLADVFRARIIDVSAQSLVLEITGSEAKLDKLLEVLHPYGVLEMARTGTLAMGRGTRRGSRWPAPAPGPIQRAPTAKRSPTRSDARPGARPFPRPPVDCRSSVTSWPLSTTTRMPTSPRSAPARSPSSATARRATPTR